MRTWRFDEVVWGETLCEAPGCLAAAAMVAELDDRDRGWPVCLLDADRLFERAAAVDLLTDSYAPFPGLW